MADGEGNSSKIGSSSKESKNKRKLVDPLPLNTVSPPSLLTEFPPYKSSLEKPQNLQRIIGPIEAGSCQPILIAKESEPNDWTDPIAIQLEGLLLSNLRTIFDNAINQIVECGYSRNIAENAISRLSLYRVAEDLVSNILDDALDLLKKGKDINASRDIVFDNLQQMTEYTMLEMVNVLKEVKPSLSTGEVMWWLLLCDMNITQATAVEGDLLSEFSCKEVLREGSLVTAPSTAKLEARSCEASLQRDTKVITPKFSAQSNLPEILKFGSLPNLSVPKNDSLQDLGSEKERVVSVTSGSEKTLGSTVQSFQATPQVSEEKLRRGHKVHKKKETASWQKSLQTERPRKHYGKPTFKSGNIGTIGGGVLEKKGKPLSELLTIPVKGSASKVKANTVVLGDESHPVSSNAPSASAATNTKVSTSSEKKVSSKPETSPSVYPDISTYLAGIPYDKSMGFLPRDEKDELILKLVPRVQQLQNELQSWTDWANQKVMEATRRLAKDVAELKALRKEKEEAEKFKKDKNILEENTMKRLSEMEFALNNTTDQIEKANSAICRLESDQLMLKKEMEAAKCQAGESASSCQQALEREQKALRDVQSLQGTKGLLQEELKSLKENVAELQQKLDKAKNVQNQIEARWEQERMGKEKLLAQAASIRKEREQLEASAKAEEDIIRQKAENNFKTTVEDIKKLENEIAEFKLKSDISTRAGLSWGFKGNYGTTDRDNANLDIDGGDDTKNAAYFKEKSQVGGLGQERECVMCLSEEMSVVFLPCAHQVLCTKCNELHEKQGMKECPSCRTSIQQRIPARFAVQQASFIFSSAKGF